MPLATPTILNLLRKRSIRAHLILLVLLSVLPALGIIIYAGLEQWRGELKEARDDCEAIVDHIAREQENLIASARQVLATMALLPELKNRDAKACNALFSKIVSQHEQFAAMSA